MSRTEAKRFVSLLKSGKIFVTRFQEEEWGLEWLKKGPFLKWSRRYISVKDKSGNIDWKQEFVQTILSPQEVLVDEIINN